MNPDRLECFLLFADVSGSPFVQFQIWDFPGDIDFNDASVESDLIFKQCGSLIFIIDAQDNYTDALIKLHKTVTRAYRSNQKIKFEVFIHKVDSLSDDQKMGTHPVDDHDISKLTASPCAPSPHVGT
jgi:Ras-related GTP-binding protein C/D